MSGEAAAILPGLLAWETPAGWKDVDVRFEPLTNEVKVYSSACASRPLFILPAGSDEELVKIVYGAYCTGLGHGKAIGRDEVRRDLRQLIGAAEDEA